MPDRQIVSLLPMAREMLVAAYVRQFESGDHLGWQAWADETGRHRDAVGRVLDGLQDKYLVAAAGGRLHVSTSGAELVERGSPPDPALVDLIGRQFALRRRILAALNDLRQQRGTFGTLAPDRIAGAVGERESKRVLPALRVLSDYFLVTPGEGDGKIGSSFRIASDGRDALSAEHSLWPLSGA